MWRSVFEIMFALFESTLCKILHIVVIELCVVVHSNLIEQRVDCFHPFQRILIIEGTECDVTDLMVIRSDNTKEKFQSPLILLLFRTFPANEIQSFCIGLCVISAQCCFCKFALISCKNLWLYWNTSLPYNSLGMKHE